MVGITSMLLYLYNTNRPYPCHTIRYCYKYTDLSIDKDTYVDHMLTYCLMYYHFLHMDICGYRQ